MNNQRISRFMWFDLGCLSFLAALSEWMSNRLLNLWNSSFYFSFSMAICLIAMIRWGAAGTAVGVIGAVPGMWFSHMSLSGRLLFYVAATGAVGIPAVLYGDRDRNLIAGNVLYLTVYVVLCHLCLAAGKGAAVFLLTGEGTGFRDYLGATLFILVINVIVCIVLKAREGLICDMRYYFKEGEDHEE